ncbi:MAG: alpha/beta hydrolase [Anaerolineales bacterium]
MPIAAGLYYFAYENENTILPPMILIHGVGGSHLSWPPEIRRLIGYNVYTVDLPGHGKSEAFGEQSISAYANHILEWMATINLYRAIMVGHSMGAAIALQIAATNPARVAGLGLVGIGLPFEVPPEMIENLSNPSMVSAALNQIKALSFSPNAPSRLVELVFKGLVDMRASVLRGDFLACARFSLHSILAQIIQPTIVIAGAQDQIVPLRYAQLLSKKITGATLRVLPDAGHLLMLEKPNDTADCLRAFLRKHEFFL